MVVELYVRLPTSCVGSIDGTRRPIAEARCDRDYRDAMRFSGKGSIPTKGHEATSGSGVISDAQDGLPAGAEFQSRD